MLAKVTLKSNINRMKETYEYRDIATPGVSTHTTCVVISTPNSGAFHVLN